MFDAVIFDFDGVILDSEPIHYEACYNIFKSVGITLSQEEFFSRYAGLSDKELFPMIIGERGYTFSSEKIQSLIEAKVNHYTAIIENHPNLPLVFGVEQYISELAKRKKTIAICSGSTRHEIMATLNRISKGALRPNFQSIITADDVQLGKPSPEGYILTANRLAVAPEKCLVIEDTPHGIEAAKTAGMHVIALTTTHAKDKLHLADQVVSNFSSLTELNLI